jgi:hypothetical protein
VIQMLFLCYAMSLQDGQVSCSTSWQERDISWCESIQRCGTQLSTQCHATGSTEPSLHEVCSIALAPTPARTALGASCMGTAPGGVQVTDSSCWGPCQGPVQVNPGTSLGTFKQ